MLKRVPGPDSAFLSHEGGTTGLSRMFGKLIRVAP